LVFCGAGAGAGAVLGATFCGFGFFFGFCGLPFGFDFTGLDVVVVVVELVVVVVVVGAVVVVGVVVVVDPHGPIVSPCCMCAGSAFRSIVIVTAGFDFEPVW
jgi:hypothetical protein